MHKKVNQIRQHNVQNPSKNIYKSFDFVNQPDLLDVIKETGELTKEQMK